MCGMSWYFFLVVEYFFEDFVKIFVEVEYVSELCYWNFFMDDWILVFVII